MSKRFILPALLPALLISSVCAGDDGTLRLVLEGAVPTLAAPETPQALTAIAVDLDVRGGAIAPQAWGYLATFPGVEHPVQVAMGEGSLSKGKFKATLTIDLLPALPLTTGGKATFTIELADVHSRWEGTYQGATTVPGAEELLEMAKKLGQRGQPIAFGVKPGKTESSPGFALHAPPVRAIARWQPLPPIPIQPGLLDTAKLNIKTLKATLSGAGGEVGPLEPGSCHGYLAAGWAALAASGDRAAVAKATETAQAAQTEIERRRDGRDPDLRLARELAGLAVAYDLLLKKESLGPAIRSVLASEAIRLSGLTQEPGKPTTLLFGPKGELGTPANARDGRLAAFRAAALLAARAALGQEANADPQLAAAAAIAGRSVRRWCTFGVGDAGCTASTAGFLSAWELVVPAILAERRAVGIDLAGGTGVGRIAGWSASCGGRSFDQTPGTDFGLPFAAVLATDDLPLVAEALGHLAWTPVNPWHALIASQPNTAKAAPSVAAKGLIREDRLAGGFIFRSGWKTDSAILTMDGCIGAAPGAANRRGQITLAGFGREWLVRPTEPFGSFDHTPLPAKFNVLALGDAPLSGLPAVVAYHGGGLNRAQGKPDGSGSASFIFQGFLQPDPKTDLLMPYDDPTYCYHPVQWRTVGVDYSGVSGAPVVIGIVEGVAGTADREQRLTLHIGDVPADRVHIGTKVEGNELNDGTFLIKPAGTNYTMKGTVLYPAFAWVGYKPPADGAPGRIELFRMKPQDANAKMANASLDKKLDEISDLIEGTGAKKQQASESDDALARDVALDFVALERILGNSKERERLHMEFYAKINKHIRSAKMGAADVPPKARNSWVVVLTIQEGAPPAVAPLPIREDPMCTIGGQTMAYEEYLVRFLKGR